MSKYLSIDYTHLRRRYPRSAGLERGPVAMVTDFDIKPCERKNTIELDVKVY